MRLVPLSAAGYLIPLITAPLAAANVASRENLIVSILQSNGAARQTPIGPRTTESELPL